MRFCANSVKQQISRNARRKRRRKKRNESHRNSKKTRTPTKMTRKIGDDQRMTNLRSTIPRTVSRKPRMATKTISRTVMVSTVKATRQNIKN